MGLLFKKLLINLIFNSCVFIILIIGIQNSDNKRKVDLLINETVELPVSFTMGISFITGSILGNILIFNYTSKK